MFHVKQKQKIIIKKVENKMEKMNVVRNVLESSYKNVTFLKSEGRNSFWLVSTERTEDAKIQVNIDEDNEVLVNSEDITIPVSVDLEIEKKLDELKGEVEKMELEKTLENGVQVFGLEMENDFYEAQKILDLSHVTDMIDADTAYSDRVSNDFVGIYKVMVERTADFKRIENMIARQKREHLHSMRSEAENKVYKFYRRGLYSLDEARKAMDKARQIGSDCKCKLCSFELTYEEWKTGKMANGAKVGKSMNKAKINKETIDLYSLQSKTEKEQLFVVSDLVQHVAGMSYYSTGQWDGMNGSSCQNPENDYEECNKLGGSLHDNKLFIGFTIDSIEDLEDLDEKMTARTAMRYLEIDGTPCLVATSYYGNNESKSMLHGAISQLEELGIFTNEVINRGEEQHIESANGSYSMTIYDTVYIDTEVEDEVTCTCPMCSGSGDYEVYSDRLDTHVEVTCPLCGGDGEYTTYVSAYVETEIEVEDEMELYPYAEKYSHYGHRIKIWLDLDYIREALKIKKVEA
jgi:hypothetical protein